MAYRDRLAASRAQRSQGIELSNVQPPAPAPAQASAIPASPSGNVLDTPTFLAEDAAIQQGIQELRTNVAQLGSLRLQSANAIDDSQQGLIDRIDSLTTDTRKLSQDLKTRIKNLESLPIQQDAQLRRNRLTLLHSKFIEALQDYQREEQESRRMFRERVERQLKIVKPDATQEEVAAAMEGGQQQIFAQALTNSTQYGRSRAAYREVQERQQEILRVEQTLAELAQLFNDMGTLVEQHDQMIDDIQTTAQNVKGDTEQGLVHTNIAVKHARSYRRGRWICFFIFLAILAILALVLGLYFGVGPGKAK